MTTRKVVFLTLALLPAIIYAWTPSLPAKGTLLVASKRPTKKAFPLRESSSVDTQVEQKVVVNGDKETTIETPKPLLEWSSILPMSGAMISATVLTFVLNNVFDWGPILSSSATGLVATLILPTKLALVALCGSFAGMAKTAVIPGIAASSVLGVVCTVMMELFDRKKWLIGVGGRLGFIAQCACTSQFLIASLFMSPTAPAALFGSYPSLNSLISRLPMVSIYTILGALGMRLWKGALSNVSARLSNAVAAVSATGLLSYLLLPAAGAGPAFCGTFVAMAAPAVLPSYKALVGASIMASVCQQCLSGVLLGGWGGKLGTAALLGVLSYNVVANQLIGKFLASDKKKVVD